MINILAIPMELFVQSFGKNSKAMTAAVITYLQHQYP
jgi:hypothetical protein